MQLMIDSEFRDLIPPLATAELQELERSILAEGIREPIAIWQGVIVDGHNRFSIAQKHGLEFQTIEREFSDRDDAKQWMIKNQLGRRNLSPDTFRLFVGMLYNGMKKSDGGDRGNQHTAPVYQNDKLPKPTHELLAEQYGITSSGRRNLSPDTFRLFVGMLYNGMKKSVGAPVGNQNAEKQIRQNGGIESPTSHQLAEQYGIGSRTVERAAKAAESIADTPLQAAVAQGEVRLNEAADVAQAVQDAGMAKGTLDFNSAVQAELDRREAEKRERTEAKRAKLEAAKERNKAIDNGALQSIPVLHHQSYKDFLPTIQGADLLITDPPYSTDVDDIESFVADWLPMALGALKDSARGYICIGAYPHELNAYIDYFLTKQDRFTLDNPLIWAYKNTLGITPKNRYNLNYQVTLHFYGKNAPELDTSVTNEMFSVQEINAPDGRQGDRYHKWQKPNELCNMFVRHSLVEGGVAIDPFSGSGSFMVAAGKAGMQAKGCDIDKDALEICAQRGCHVQW